MALVAEALLSASLQVLFDRMASPEVLNFFRAQKFTNPALLKKLKIALLTVHVVLSDAEVKQTKNSAVKGWIQELRAAACEAEDLLDEIGTEALRCKMESDPQASTSQVWHSLSSSLNPFGDRVESRVEKIIDTLGFLAQQKDVLGLKEGVGEKLAQRWLSTSVVDESGVYGRDGSKEEIIEMLLSDNASECEISVIAIIGLAGIGKTALTQLVYNDERVKSNFDMKAWVCVSEEFDFLTITKSIFGACPPTFSSTCDVSDLNLLQVEIKKRLNGKKFLVVLDDVWNESYNTWDMLCTPLKVGASGSKFIVTTRNENVALTMRALRTHHVDQLSFEDSWRLFARLTFENEDPRAYPDLEAIAKEIVKKCQGLPLSIKTLGGLLHYKKDKKEWDDILRSEMWDLPSDEILLAFRLSYSHLPLQLKRCFAYCSIFPKGYQFQKERLVLLWMAQGLLPQSKSKKRTEEAGDRYFDELLSRSFFQTSSRRSYFVMHDLVNDLARLVSGEFCIQCGEGKKIEIYEETRHLSYHIIEHDSFERFETLSEVKCLRTFLKLQSLYSSQNYLSNRVLHDIVPSIKCLRVLSLANYWIADLPDSMGNLKSLRYLNLSSTYIRRLPDSLCSLYNLQTILLNGCHRLLELPSGLKKLVNLRHLNFCESGVKEMPNHIGKLTNLQKLSNFIVGQRSGCRIGELRELSQIGGKLHISEVQNVVCGTDALEANLKNKNVDELVLSWKSNTEVLQNGIDIINNLQPHENVKRLTIDSYGGARFPDWLGDSLFSNMVFLSLKNCQHCSSLPVLGQLPSLKHLYISGMNAIERVSREFYGDNSSSVKPFTALGTLVFENMRQWKEWESFGGAEGGAFPHLQVLRIRHCPKLTGEVPCQLSSLTELEIVGCKQLVASVPRVPAIRVLKILRCGQVLFGSPPYDFSHLENSEIEIEIADLSQWTELPQGLRGFTILRCFSTESLLEGMIENNARLQHLVLKRCCFSRSLLRCCLPTALKSLQIWGCGALQFLLPELLKCQHPFLEQLVIRGGYCRSFSAFSFGFFPKLTRLEIHGIKGLVSLTFSISEGNLAALNFLLIHCCSHLVSIELPALMLTSCEINHCQNLESLKCPLASFEKLILQDCPLLSFPVRGWASSLNSLRINNCDKLTRQVEWGLQGLLSLVHFSIGGGSQGVESFPKEGLLPSTLESLVIQRFPSLRSLDGKGLQLLTSLQKLEIYDCHTLQSLPKEGLPTSISFLKISNCPLLKHRCQFWKGEDWQHIAHIPGIVVDDKVL